MSEVSLQVGIAIYWTGFAWGCALLASVAMYAHPGTSVLRSFYGSEFYCIDASTLLVKHICVVTFIARQLKNRFFGWKRRECGHEVCFQSGILRNNPIEPSSSSAVGLGRTKPFWGP